MNTLENNAGELDPLEEVGISLGATNSPPGLRLPSDVIGHLKFAMEWEYEFILDRLTPGQKKYHEITRKDPGRRHDMVLVYMAGDRGVSLTDPSFEDTTMMGWLPTQGDILAQSGLVEIREGRAYITKEGIEFVRAVGGLDQVGDK